MTLASEFHIQPLEFCTKVYLVTNADKFKHYERWATASDFPTDNIVNDGSTDHADRLGSVADLALCLRAKKIVEEDSSCQEVLVIAGDMIFQVWNCGYRPR